MTAEVFEHPALSSAAAELAELRAAAGRLGVADPVAALRHLDCAPASIRTSAAAVDTGALAVTSAQAEFRAGVERAENGGSTETFGTWADTVDGQYAAAARAAAETAALGARLADRLDELAVAASSEVCALASAASASVSAVLAGDRSAEVVSEVSATCTAVVRAVSAKIALLSSLAAELEPLTAPAVELS
ncbi:hypothetical protein [Amycolatopsis sp.]|uniref:hypothetical protein n=1 Tax=Amycolatopsis sp. TaxID=37632 RepID=UPI002D803A1D|nr:hypothetical protein [Amycolatopsis sp.]HET6703951.1 hypothetical protein [Amycolatopsis sp.]